MVAQTLPYIFFQVRSPFGKEILKLFLWNMDGSNVLDIPVKL
jgi:hypothetical protein